METTIALFKIGPDCYTALAVNVNDQKELWRRTYESLDEMVMSLAELGAISAADIKNFKSASWFQDGLPILRLSLARDLLETAGFASVASPQSLSEKHKHLSSDEK